MHQISQEQQPTRPAARRSLRRPSGVREIEPSWTVYEECAPSEQWTRAEAEHHAHGHGIGWLIFAAPEVRKRLRLYPTGWPLASADELEALFRGARPF